MDVSRPVGGGGGGKVLWKWVPEKEQTTINRNHRRFRLNTELKDSKK